MLWQIALVVEKVGDDVVDFGFYEPRLEVLFFPAAVGDGVVDDRSGPREGGDESPWRDSKTRVEDMKKEFASVGVDIAEICVFFVDDVEAGASNCGVDGDFDPPPQWLENLYITHI